MKFKAVILALLSTLGCMAQKQITYDDIANSTFDARTISGLRPMLDGEHYTTLHKGVIVRYRYSDGEAVDTVFDASRQTPALEIADYTFSHDESKILLPTNREKIYRHSSRADFWVYDRAKGSLAPLSGNGKQQEATLSPDGSKAAFVRDNNLYVVDLARGGTETAITTDGSPGTIINGIPDWVYEEEYSFARAYEWSPASDAIAFYRFDESGVKSYDMSTFRGELYPRNYSFKYPKAGQDNALVEIRIYSTGNADSPASIRTVDIGPEKDIYIPRIEWIETSAGEQLVAHRLNRLQNDYQILTTDSTWSATTGAIVPTRTLYSEQNAQYIERINDQTATFLPADGGFIIKSERDGWMHLYHYNMHGEMIRQITRGRWEVTSLLGVDTRRGTVYYQSTERSPLQRDIYSIGLDGRHKIELSTKRGTNQAILSTGNMGNTSSTPKYYINYYSSASTPTCVTLHRSDGRMVRTLEDNADLVDRLDGLAIPRKEFFSFTTHDGVELNGFLLKPVDFDSTRRYPIFMTQYSGPGSQRVQDAWGVSWEAALLGEGIIVACVDPRGTGFRGEQFRKCTYGQLGRIETEDQIAAARYLGALPFVDSARMAIYGWSYGGFMALNCILRGNDIFALAVAVAPVTSWRYYDTIYTELYNGLPQDNAKGYDGNSPINFADRLRGKLLIAHGTGDDNVHIQNTYEMISRLSAADKKFEMMIYPDQDHSMGRSRNHLMLQIIDFVKHNL